MTANNGFRFSVFSRRLAVLAGRPATFVTALALVLLWGVTGPVFGFSDTWQLVINTSTTIITFLMVFLIQNTQNDDRLEQYLRTYQRLAATSRAKLRKGELDTDSPDIKALQKE